MDKLEILASLLAESSLQDCKDGFQPYPDEIWPVGDFLAVATVLPNGAPRLLIYSRRQAEEWLASINEIQKTGCGLAEAVCWKMPSEADMGRAS